MKYRSTEEIEDSCIKPKNVMGKETTISISKRSNLETTLKL